MHNTDGKIHTIDFNSMRDFLKDMKAALQSPSVSKFTSCIHKLYFSANFYMISI